MDSGETETARLPKVITTLEEMKKKVAGRGCQDVFYGGGFVFR